MSILTRHGFVRNVSPVLLGLMISVTTGIIINIVTGEFSTQRDVWSLVAGSASFLLFSILAFKRQKVEDHFQYQKMVNENAKPEKRMLEFEIWPVVVSQKKKELSFFSVFSFLSFSTLVLCLFLVLTRKQIPDTVASAIKNELLLLKQQQDALIKVTNEQSAKMDKMLEKLSVPRAREKSAEKLSGTKKK